LRSRGNKVNFFDRHSMASFPILTRDPEPHGNYDPREPAVLAYRRDPLRGSASESYRAAKSIAEVGGLDEIPLPAVVLQLPDLKSSSYLRRGGRVPLATHAYWVALVLGALLAFWLVFSGRKSIEPPADEAPAWTGQAAPAADRVISSWGDNTGEQSAPAPKWRASDTEPTPGYQNELPTYTPSPPGETAHGAADPAAPALPYVGTPPIADGALAPQQQSEAIRTARGGETYWDGSSNRIQPSEAAPLGITTPVPQ
jgi:hypothetical protein